MLDYNEIMLPVGTVLRQRYRIEKYLASGGFGNTYLARDILFDEPVAIKEFFMRSVSNRDTQSLTVSVSNPTNLHDFTSQLEKFRKEAKRLRKLQNDHIVKVHDLFDEFGTSYYVMDYVRGESLSAIMKQRGMPFDEPTVLGFLDQVLDALTETHSHSIWHLDIKPGNLMMDATGKLTLIDFGASKLTDPTGEHSTSAMMAYTPGFAPIEQMEQRLEAIGPYTDFYALGATLYNLLTCQNPPERSLIDEYGDAAFHYPVAVSPAMRNLIRFMMKPLRRFRPQNIEQVRKFIAYNNLAPAMPAQADDVVMVDDVTVQLPVNQQPLQAPANTSAQRIQVAPVERPVNNVAQPVPKQQQSRKLALGIGIAAAVAIIAAVVAFSLSGGHTDDTASTTSQADNTAQEQTPKVSDQEFTVNGVTFTMVGVEGGTFTMGATGDGGDAHEKPAHEVTLGDFCIGQTEVTQELWEAVMGKNPSGFTGELQQPVENVSWDDCQKFISKLNEASGQNFRLPTEAEWEYAARGGNKSSGFDYSGSKTARDVAWYEKDTTKPIAMKGPNELNLYDMSGNVAEWCQDWYGSYDGDAQTNPTGPDSGSERVCRGGSWANYGKYCTVSTRDKYPQSFKFNGIGLRLAL